jgi:hypothetical protein
MVSTVRRYPVRFVLLFVVLALLAGIATACGDDTSEPPEIVTDQSFEILEDPSDGEREAFRQAAEALPHEELLELVEADPEGVCRMTKRPDGTCLRVTTFGPVIKGDVEFAEGVMPPDGFFEDGDTKP